MLLLLLLLLLLQCVPSANDFLAATGGTGTAGGSGSQQQQGLVRQPVTGPMASNYTSRHEIEAYINRKLARLDPARLGAGGGGGRVSYPATPQGFVNAEQAWRVVEELARYMDGIRRPGQGGNGNGNGNGRPLSCGIITLNRPQRQLIHLLVAAAAPRVRAVEPQGKAEKHKERQ
eukprot:SAG22_NODE_383_length_11344_cov_6.163895_4_plen_175_part_00